MVAATTTPMWPSLPPSRTIIVRHQVRPTYSSDDVGDDGDDRDDGYGGRDDGDDEDDEGGNDDAWVGGMGGGTLPQSPTSLLHQHLSLLHRHLLPAVMVPTNHDVLFMAT